MRITNNMIVTQQVTGLQSNIAALKQAQDRVTTGKRVGVASDDPSAAMSVMQTRSSLHVLDQYRTNVQRASSRVNLEDGVLQQVGDLVTRAKQLALSQTG